MTDVEDLAQQFRGIRERAAQFTAPLTEAQFNWRPGPARWSIAECFDHLTVTARAVERKMRPVIAEGRQRGLTGSGPFRYGWFSRWFEAEMEPPPRRRQRSPRAFAIEAGSTHDKVATMKAFDAAGEVWAGLLDAARGLDLRRIKVASPASRLLHFPLGAYFRISSAHERRHLWQAEQVVKAPGFPA
jgi:hypothetical protein